MFKLTIQHLSMFKLIIQHLFIICSMKHHEEIDKKFLYKENRQLRVELNEAKQVNLLHKDAIRKLSQPHINSNGVISILLSLLSQSEGVKKIERLKEEIMGLESKQMVLQKIVEQADNDEKENYHLLVEDFNKLRQDNEKLENQLHKFYQKIGEVDYLSGLVTKHKEIISPSEQSLSFKKQQDQLLEFISMQKDQINKLTEEKNKLLKINIHMKEEVELKKEDIRNMTMIFSSPEMMMNISMQNGQNGYDGHNGHNGHNGYNGQESNNNQNILDELEEIHNTEEDQNKEANNSMFNVSVFNSNNLNSSSYSSNLNTTLNNFIKMQKKVIKEEDEEECGSGESDEEVEDCPELHVLFPDKVEQIKKNKETTRVPYLNMVKIREMMAKREKKIRKQVEADINRINPTDKIIKLETELDITRKQLASQTLKFRHMQEELQSFQRMNEELENRSIFLAQSNEKLQTNYQNVYKDYQLTKIIALRVEKALDKDKNICSLVDELNTSKDYEEKLSALESMIRKIFGSKATPKRSQSVHIDRKTLQF